MISQARGSRYLSYRWRLAAAFPQCNVCTARADVAQLVEQRFRKPQVTGSNPVVGSTLHSQQRGERKRSRRSPDGGESFDPK
jgi:hypothetical protein